MISRLTASAALFAILATAGLGFAADAQQGPAAKQPCAAASMPTITMPPLSITGKRLHAQLTRPARRRPAPAPAKRAFSTADGPRNRRLPGKPIVCRGA